MQSCVLNRHISKTLQLAVQRREKSWLLRAIFDVVGNWGLAIILLTVMVKILLYPLTAKQMQSMARMKELKPDMAQTPAGIGSLSEQAFLIDEQWNDLDAVRSIERIWLYQVLGRNCDGSPQLP